LWLAGSQALISEFVGTAFWIWTIEAVRRDRRYSIPRNQL